MTSETASWRLCDRTHENLVVFQNIHWPGLLFHHAMDGGSFGRFYCGRGLREISVPFLYGAPGDTVLSVDISIVPDYDMNVSYEERERVKKEKFDAAEKAAEQADFDQRYEAGGSVYSSEGEQTENAELLETGDVQPIDYSAPPSQDE
ncbi:hypothetical protein RvY_00013 [Ramazzottius varieornatus]|uniref:Uncharacterized protein n=1 Tax=Ramazzottius varieornatus TaxID=947166 RepID=A0A1D1UBN5_RAMVA|nr:hypothetical protein RvY_00013 [Ramazzottius varieornatus]